MRLTNVSYIDEGISQDMPASARVEFNFGHSRAIFETWQHITSGEKTTVVYLYDRGWVDFIVTADLPRNKKEAKQLLKGTWVFFPAGFVRHWRPVRYQYGN